MVHIPHRRWKKNHYKHTHPTHTHICSICNVSAVCAVNEQNFSGQKSDAYVMKCSDEKEKLTSAMLFNDGAAMNTTYGANSAVRSIFIACGSTSRIAILPSPWMQRMVSNLVPYIASSCVPIFYDSVRGLFMFGLLSQRQRSSAANFVQNNRRTRWRERVKWTRYQDKWNNQKTRIFVRVKTFLHNTNYFAIFVGQIECVLATKQLHTFRSCYEKLNVLIINVIFACSSVRPTTPPPQAHILPSSWHIELCIHVFNIYPTKHCIVERRVWCDSNTQPTDDDKVPWS